MKRKNKKKRNLLPQEITHQAIKECRCEGVLFKF